MIIPGLFAIYTAVRNYLSCNLYGEEPSRLWISSRFFPLMQGSQNGTFLQLGGVYLWVQKGLKQVILFCSSGKLYTLHAFFFSGCYINLPSQYQKLMIHKPLSKKFSIEKVNSVFSAKLRDALLCSLTIFNCQEHVLTMGKPSWIL